MTRGVFRELSPFVEGQECRVPVFGFPLICYSPRLEVEDWVPRYLGGSRSCANLGESKWQHISKGIVSKSLKQVLVKELLEGRNKIMQQEEDM